MYRRSLVLITAAMLVVAGGTVRAQKAAPPATADTSVTIAGEVEHPGRITVAELLALPHRSVAVDDPHENRSVYEGVALGDVLQRAGAPSGERLRGRVLGEYYLKIGGGDGFGAIFALPEIDSTFTDREIIIAYLRDGAPLSAKDGPLQIIIPSDKRHGRWVRQVSVIEVVHDGR